MLRSACVTLHFCFVNKVKDTLTLHSLTHSFHRVVKLSGHLEVTVSIRWSAQTLSV